jgi:hypothetical protein
MANAAQNISYNASGPAFSFQQVALGGKDASELAYRGSITFTGDNATSTVVANFIDGTQTPFFTQANPPVAAAPKLVLANISSGATATTFCTVGVTSITTTGCTLQFNGTTPASSITVALVIIPY